MSVGNRVFLQRELPDMELVKRYQRLPAANVADTMSRSCALNSEIHLISSPDRPIMAGPALTVKARPGDNLMLYKALDMAQEGDVIVVSNDGDRTHSLMGEIMAVYAQNKGKVAGIVLDGPIRDMEELFQMSLFLYATGSTPGGPYKEGPGEINVPISIGNIAVKPGDIILGDRDGVIVIPQEDAASIIDGAEAYAAMDAGKVEEAKNGTSKRQWVEDTLAKKNVEIIDGTYKG